MLEVITQQLVLSARSLVFSWLSGIAAFLATPFIMVVGQGFGSWFGDAQWIGISTPLTHHPWALINQPNLAFASTSSAAGYWFGAYVLAIILGAGAPALAHRSKANAGKLAAIQLAWASVVVAGAWFPLSDLDDGHLARWLTLNNVPLAVIWIAPLVAGIAFVPTCLQLLALGREGRSRFGLPARLATVVLDLWIPALIWALALTLVRGEFVVRSSFAVLIPMGITTVVCLMGWGRSPVFSREPVPASSFVSFIGVAMLLGAALWFCGRPLENGRVAGVQWAKANSYNNIRAWIETNPRWRSQAPAGEISAPFKRLY
jgi:hypothetical protein